MEINVNEQWGQQAYFNSVPVYACGIFVLGILLGMLTGKHGYVTHMEISNSMGAFCHPLNTCWVTGWEWTGSDEWTSKKQGPQQNRKR
jgi:hypothetical protein